MAVRQQVVLAPGARWLGESGMEPLIEGAVAALQPVASARPRVGTEGAPEVETRRNGVPLTLSPPHPSTPSSARPPDVFLDLRAVVRVEPYALVTLCMVLRYLAERGVTPYLLLPEEEGALATLHRAGFGSAAQRYVGNELRFEVGRREAEAAPVVVGLTPIHGAADVETARAALTGAREAVRDYLRFHAGEAALLEASLVELAHNVWQHSEDWGLVCVARGIQPRTERRSVTVAVADLGIGIRESLAQRYEISDWSDADAILHAVRPGYSRCGERRGIGLTQALAVARRFDGAFVIRSGTARVHFSDRRSHSVAPFLGVQASLTVRGHR